MAIGVVAAVPPWWRCRGRYSVGALDIRPRENLAVPATQFAAVRVRRDGLVAGVDANFRFGFLNAKAYVAKAFSPQSSVPGTGRDVAARSGFN